MRPYLPTYTKSRALVLRFSLALWALLEAVAVSTRRGQLPAQGQMAGRLVPFPAILGIQAGGTKLSQDHQQKRRAITCGSVPACN